MAHDVRPSIWETEAGRPLSVRPAWSTSIKIFVPKTSKKKRRRRTNRKQKSLAGWGSQNNLSAELTGPRNADI